MQTNANAYIYDTRTQFF